jgi:nucleotide-binding universal stress UspA family protein
VLYVLELWLASRSWIATPTPEEREVHQRFLAREESAIAGRLRDLVKSRIGADGKPGVRIIVHDGHAADIIAAVGNETSAGLIVVARLRQPRRLRAQWAARAGSMTAPLLTQEALAGVDRGAKRGVPNTRDSTDSSTFNLSTESDQAHTKGRPETLGSVAERVVRIARRPVLVVPA